MAIAYNLVLGVFALSLTAEFLAGPILADSSVESIPCPREHKTILGTMREGGRSERFSEKYAYELVFFGQLTNEHTSFCLYEYTLHWGGPPANRATYRLVVLSAQQEFLGTYTMESRPIEISGNMVLFDGDEELGNVIRFDKIEPPQKVYLDGRFSYLTK